MDESDDGDYIEKLSSGDEGDYGMSKRTRNKSDSTPGVPKSSTGNYAWEDEYQRSWDVVQEDEGGSLAGAVAGLVEARKRRLLRDDSSLQRGIIRTVVLVLDMSFAMKDKDLRPNRFALTVNYALEFINDFFDQNPISQLGIIAMKNGVAVMVSDIGSNPHEHVELLRQLKTQDVAGEPSLQNALEMARGLLLHVASHCTKEILIVFGALMSTDPGDIHKTIGSLVKEKIRVKIIGLAAQVAICSEITRRTNFGDEKNNYGVILNETHFKELLMNQVTPPALSASSSSTRDGYALVRMGFPVRVSEATPSFCFCHSKLRYGGFVCPQCRAKVCALPTVCPGCSLMLILSTHLARSLHHLLPLQSFEEVPVSSSYPSTHCYGCQVKFPNESQISSRYMCPKCREHFCIDCDVFCHESLHTCPGCESGVRGNGPST